MGVIVKRGIYIGLVVLLAGSLVSCASKETPVAQAPEACATTSALAHSGKDVAAPTAILTEKISTITLKTNCGDIGISVDQTNAPVTVTAITALARAGFYDASLCHRLTTAGLFVLQCGDPTATGGGPSSFTYRDENLPAQIENNYPAGTVAMANSGANTNGSQFFLVYKDTTLGSNYTIWGKITSGLDVVQKVAAAGVVDGSGDGTPALTVAIESVVVK